MATALNTFRLPSKIPAFIPYNGPPKPKKPKKPKAARRCVRKSLSPVSEEWPDIDEILGTIPKPKAASKDGEQPKYWGLLDSGMLSTDSLMQVFQTRLMYER
jgi:hypothetical protein